MSQELSWQERVLATLNGLQISHFEKFCNTFLAELGFVKLKTAFNSQELFVTGSGIIELGVVAHQFVFLAKQNTGINNAEMALDIRKLMNAYSNKGILISTGKFSRELKKEAKKRGEVPIDLIDGDNLVERLTKMDVDFLIKDGSGFTVNQAWIASLVNEN